MLLPVILVPESQERRRRPRLRLTYPVVLYRVGNDSRIHTTTEDISCEGFLCTIESALSPSETVECELTIPWHDREATPDGRLILQGRAEVVRVVAHEDSAFAVACRFSDYRIHETAEKIPVQSAT